MIEAYQKLWIAVLEQAIKDVRGDVRGQKGKVKSIFSEGAWAWFRSESQEVGSFHWTCNMLGLEPNFILTLVTQEDAETAESKYMACG